MQLPKEAWDFIASGGDGHFLFGNEDGSKGIVTRVEGGWYAVVPRMFKQEPTEYRFKVSKREG